jgi:acyl-CoA thioester hydrolase
MRWIDQDVYHHLNNGTAVTLLEEARVAMMFDAAEAEGVTGFRDGLLVVGLHVDYRRQITYRTVGLRVAMQIEDLRAASFRISYALHDGPEASDPVAITGWTRMAPYELAAGHPRRLTPAERAYLDRWAS